MNREMQEIGNAAARRNFELEDEERKAYIRRYIGVPLDPETRELVLKEYDTLIKRYELFTQC